MSKRPPRGPSEKTKRPRDELGRLLPWEEDNLLEMEDFDALPLEECHRLGIAHWNAGRFFPAHEAWEAAWKKAKGTKDEEFFKGLSQLGAGYVHYGRGNAHGTKTLLRRGVSRVGRYDTPHHRIDVESLVSVAENHAAAVESALRSGEPLPEIVPPRV